MKNKSYILIFLVALLILGCSYTYKGKPEYVGWNFPPRERVAIIAGSGYYWVLFSYVILITSVDSISRDRTDIGYPPVAVSPGKHTVIVDYMGSTGSSRQFKLVFDVEAGHKYKIKLKSRWGKASLLVVDTESGMVVGSSD